MVQTKPLSPVPVEALDALVTVLDLVRTGRATTRPAVAQRSGLGRTVVVQRVEQLLASGLITEGSFAPSTGGRPARELRFCADAGCILVADLGATSLAVGLTDLAGTLLTSSEEPHDIAAGPEPVLRRVEELCDALLAARDGSAAPVWGIGVGLPGPVEFAAGRPIAPPIMPGWDGYPVRDRLAARYGVPTWVDNDVNLLALAELRIGLARQESDIIVMKIGSGIGAGVISGGRLHRGQQGAAGDVGHVAVTDDPAVICRCGNVGCLEAVAGGAALGRLADEAGTAARSPFLSARRQERQPLDAADLALAAVHGDPLAVRAFARSGESVGRVLATLVNFFNPSLVIIGGGVAGAGDVLLAAIRQTVYRRSLPLATRELRIVWSSTGATGGLRGAAFVVIDELFSLARVGRWIDGRSPAGRPDIALDVTTAA